MHRDPHPINRQVRRPVLAYHVIFTTYGFWLPNDPRGSWSDFVGSWELFQFGRATRTNTRKSIAHHDHDRAARLAARQSLKYPPVVFNGLQALAVARGFGRIISKCRHSVHACSILPDHVHLVIGRHRYPVEQVARLLKAEAGLELLRSGIHPLNACAAGGKTPTPWAGGLWKVFLFDDADVMRSIRYVENNPIKDGKRPQRWSFVQPFAPAQ